MPVLNGPSPIQDLFTNNVAIWNFGPFQAQDGSVYLVLTQDGVGNRATYLFKSDTGITGLTWTLVATYATGAFLQTIAWDPATDSLMEIYLDTGSSQVNLSIVDVNTLVQTVVNLTPAVGFTGVSSSAISKSDNGTITCFVSRAGTTHAVEVTGGVLGATFSFGDPVGVMQNQIVPHFNIIPAALDNRYVMNGGVANPWRVATVDSADSAVASDLGPGLPVTPTGQVAVIYQGLLFVVLGNLGGQVQRATDATASSFVTSLTLLGGEGELNLVTDGTTNLYVVYSRQQVSGGAMTQDQVFVRKYLGGDTWGSEQLGADFLVNPPPFTPPEDFVAGSHYKSVALLNDGSFGMGISFFDPTQLLCIAFYVRFAPSAGPSDLALACQTNPLGFLATGGTPPYTFAIVAGALPSGLTLDASTGVISGTPTETGTFNYTGQVTDATLATATADCSVTIPPDFTALSLACQTSPVGFHRTGGLGPFTFAIIAGSLPPGMSLDTTTGLIIGSPTASGTYNYTGRVTDSLGETATANCSIVIPHVALACQASPLGFLATGGVPPYSFVIIAGAIPPGMVLNNSTGLITGSPTAEGTFNYTGQVTDSLGETATAMCQKIIPPVTLACQASPPGFLAADGIPPYTFAIIAGAVPPGMTLQTATGLITGTATATGTFSYTGRVTDSIGGTATANCQMTIGTGMVLACQLSPPGFVASGGIPPYTFQIIGGALPPGMTLNSSTGLIEGTAQSSGLYTYTGKATDSAGSTAQATCQLNVPPPTPTACTSVTKFKLWDWALEIVKEPAAVAQWDSFPQSFGWKFYKFLKQFWIMYKCGSSMTLTITSDKGVFTKVLPPHSSRSTERFYLPVEWVGGPNKSILYRFHVDANSPFQIYNEASGVEWLAIASDRHANYRETLVSEFMTMGE